MAHGSLWAMAAVGLVAGVFVGLTSTGGGSLLTPMLLLLGVPPSIAVGSSVLVASGMKLFGSGIYAARKNVHWPTVARLAAGSVPGTVVGIGLLDHLPAAALEGVLRHLLGAALVVAGAGMAVRCALAGRPKGQRMPPTAAIVALGFVTGALVSTTSVGSGSLLLCVMTLFFPLSAPTLIGTDLAHALLVSTAATALHLAAGRVDVALALAVLVGGVPGVAVGARLATVVPERALRVGLAVVLLGVGVQLSATHTPAPLLAEGAAAR